MEYNFIAATLVSESCDGQLWSLTDGKRRIALADDLIFTTDLSGLLHELSQRAPIEDGCSFVEERWDRMSATLSKIPRVSEDMPIQRVIDLCKKYGQIRFHGSLPETWQSAGICNTCDDTSASTYVYNPNKIRKTLAERKRKMRARIQRGQIPFEILQKYYGSIVFIIYNEFDFIKRTRSPKSNLIAAREFPKLIKCLRAFFEPYECKAYVEFLKKVRQFRSGILRRETKVEARKEWVATWKNFAHWIKQEIHNLCAYHRKKKLEAKEGENPVKPLLRETS